MSDVLDAQGEPAFRCSKCNQDVTVDLSTLRACTRCKREFSLGHFHRDKTHPNGRKTACPECRSQSARKMKAPGPEPAPVEVAPVEVAPVEVAPVEVDPAELARASAVERLIDTYPTQFNKLLYSEYVQRNLISPKEREHFYGWRKLA